MYHAFLIKYAEIGIKGKNRYIFENILRDRIKKALDQVTGDFYVVKEPGRIFVEAQTEFDYEETMQALQKVFGIWAICPTMVINDRTWKNIANHIEEYVLHTYEKKDFTFKVEAKRSDKKYPMTSPEICAQAGEVILKKFPELKVDVRKPKERIYIEVRGSAAYIYSKMISGPGGMPVGSSGKAMLLLSGGIDSPVAGYMISKRGVEIDAVYFHAPPYTSDRAKQKVVELAKKISAYTGPIRLHVINFTEIQLYIYDKCPHDELTIIMRRYMMRIAEHLARNNNCNGLITGESIGQVASQTMQSLMATNSVCTLPVYRPLIAFDKQEIVDIAEKIDTYETSIQPFEDCCTIFVAKHPVTKPNANIIARHEGNLREEIDEMVKKALETVEIIEIRPAMEL